MLRNTFVDTVMKRLGNNNDTSLRDDIIHEMTVIQANILEGDVFKPWFLLSEESSSVTVIGEERLALPGDFVGLWEEAGLHTYDDTQTDPYTELDREDWADIKANLDYSGKPTYFDLAGFDALVRPVPDAIYPIRFWYYARGADLAGTYDDPVTNITNVWLENAADWFLGEVCLVVSELYIEGAASKSKVFEKQIIRARTRVMHENVARQEALKVRLRGG